MLSCEAVGEEAPDGLLSKAVLAEETVQVCGSGAGGKTDCACWDGGGDTDDDEDGGGSGGDGGGGGEWGDGECKGGEGGGLWAAALSTDSISSSGVDVSS